METGAYGPATEMLRDLPMAVIEGFGPMAQVVDGGILGQTLPVEVVNPGVMGLQRIRTADRGIGDEIDKPGRKRKRRCPLPEPAGQRASRRRNESAPSSCNPAVSSEPSLA
jgi:hypothetical protein